MYFRFPFWFVGYVLTALIACSSPPKKTGPILNRTCGPTPVMRSDLTQFNVTPAEGKVTVVRFLRSSCPYCKEDLQQIGLFLNTGQWKPDDLQIVLIAYKKPGVESRKTFDDFVRELAASGFPIDKTQLVYLDKTYPALLKAKAKSGQAMLAGWKAVPFGLVFGKDGRLAYRGQFTLTNNAQNQHYDFIGELLKETCPARLP